VFDSLQAQTCRDFEWLVIDDGSTDGTAALMQRYQAEAGFPVRYLQEPHRGAHHAHNLSMRESRGEFWLKLDSDDGCVPQALERLQHHWENIPQARRDTSPASPACAGIKTAALVGTPFPADPLDCSAAALEYHYKVFGEHWGFLRLDVVRRFPYPDNVPGNFIPESFIWCQVSQRYQTRHINEALRIYWMDAPSLVHGRADPRTNAAGHRLMFKMVLNLGKRLVLHRPAAPAACRRAVQPLCLAQRRWFNHTVYGSAVSRRPIALADGASWRLGPVAA
jgi:glycosyltransferase involved in cell wall biosynthesis